MSQLREQIKRIFDTSRDPFDGVWQWAKRPGDSDDRRRRWDALAEWAGDHKHQQDHDSEEWRAWKRRQRIYRAKADGLDSNVPGVEDGGWHPDAIRTQQISGYAFTGGPAKGVLHTTEGSSLPTYHPGWQPHFTIDAARDTLWQHVDVRRAAGALANPAGGVQTNTDRAIQIEIIGFASRTPLFGERELANIADLMRWIEKTCNVPRRCTVQFEGYPPSRSVRMTGPQWDDYSGWCGHQHVPENDHGDPGGIAIGKLV